MLKPEPEPCHEVLARSKATTDTSRAGSRRRKPWTISPNPLPLRIGPIGYLSHARPKRPEQSEKRNHWRFDWLQSRGFHAYGFPAVPSPDGAEAETVREYALRADVETHVVCLDDHLAHEPTGDPSPYRGLPYAVAANIAYWHQLAEEMGAASYTHYPLPCGDVDAAPVHAELERIFERLDAAGPSRCRFHLSNSHLAHHPLSLPTALLDAVREWKGLHPTLNLAHAYQRHACPSNVDDWRSLLRECPPETLFVYTNTRPGLDAAATGVDGYWSDEEAKPRLRPLLEAFREERRAATVLVRAHHVEYGALCAAELACDVFGIDRQHFLKTRVQHRDYEDALHYGIQEI